MHEYSDMKIQVFRDMKIQRTRDLWTHGCRDIGIWRSGDVEISRSEDPWIDGCRDTRICQCMNMVIFKIHRSRDPKIQGSVAHGCRDTGIWGSVDIRRCTTPTCTIRAKNNPTQRWAIFGRNALQGGTVSSQLIVLVSKISGLASFHSKRVLTRLPWHSD